MDDKERQQMRIFVSPGAKKAVEEFAAKYSMTEFGVASRLYTWFARQPKSIQKWVVGLLEDGEGGEAAREFATALLESVNAPPVKESKGASIKGGSLKKVP